jgi:hypothetical protein
VLFAVRQTYFRISGTCFGTVSRFFCSVALLVQAMHYRIYSRGSFETFTQQVPELPDQKPAQGVPTLSFELQRACMARHCWFKFLVFYSQ